MRWVTLCTLYTVIPSFQITSALTVKKKNIQAVVGSLNQDKPGESKGESATVVCTHTLTHGAGAKREHSSRSFDPERSQRSYTSGSVQAQEKGSLRGPPPGRGGGAAASGTGGFNTTPAQGNAQSDLTPCTQYYTEAVVSLTLLCLCCLHPPV